MTTDELAAIIDDAVRKAAWEGYGHGKSEDVWTMLSKYDTNPGQVKKRKPSSPPPSVPPQSGTMTRGG
jgi:hypothetical protein